MPRGAIRRPPGTFSKWYGTDSGRLYFSTLCISGGVVVLHTPGDNRGCWPTVPSDIR